MPCSFGTKATVKSPPPEPPLLPPLSLDAEPPLPSPHAVRVSRAARPREAVSLVDRVVLIGSPHRSGGRCPAVPPARRAGADLVGSLVRCGGAPVLNAGVLTGGPRGRRRGARGCRPARARRRRRGRRPGRCRRP